MALDDTNQQVASVTPPAVGTSSFVERLDKIDETLREIGRWIQTIAASSSEPVISPLVFFLLSAMINETINEFI